MKKQVASIVASVVLLTGLSGGLASADTCSVTWGSGAKSAGPTTSATRQITNIRTGRHTCFDRMVIDINNATAAGYRVEYVSNIYADPSGELIPISGGAKLQIVTYAGAYKPDGTITYPALTGKKLPNVNLTGYQTFRDAKFAGSFEGVSSVGLGVRARLPFTVFKSSNHIIIDVAHHW